MRTEIVEYDDGELHVRLVVSGANNLIGAVRLRLIGEAIAYAQDEKADPDKKTLRWTYAPLIAATIEAQGIPWPLSFEEFGTLIPEPLTDQWGDAVRRLNPHWYVETAQGDDAEKKAMTSTGASPGG